MVITKFVCRIAQLTSEYNFEVVPKQSNKYISCIGFVYIKFQIFLGYFLLDERDLEKTKVKVH